MKWSEKAGLVISQAHFVDVYGFDDEVRLPGPSLSLRVNSNLTDLQLLAMVPKPVKAVILLFPIDAASEARRQEEDEQIAKEGQPKLEDTIFFVKQTVRAIYGCPSSRSDDI